MKEHNLVNDTKNESQIQKTKKYRFHPRDSKEILMKDSEILIMNLNMVLIEVVF